MPRRRPSGPRSRDSRLQLRPFFRAELHFVGSLCGLAQEQRDAFAREAQPTLLEAARAFATNQREIQQGRWRRGSNNLDPRATMQAAMLRLVRDRLTPEQSALYAAEVERRSADRKRVSIDNIVAQMDIELELTADQREGIARAISRDWDDAWDLALEVYEIGPQFLPNLPAKLTDPFLNDAQKRLWRETPCSQIFYFGWIGFLHGLFTDAHVLEDGTLILDGIIQRKTVTAEVRAGGPGGDEGPAGARAGPNPGRSSDEEFDGIFCHQMSGARLVPANWDTP